MQMISYDLYMFLTNEHLPQEVKMRDSIIKPQTLFLLAAESEHNASSIVLDHFLRRPSRKDKGSESHNRKHYRTEYIQ